MSIFGCQGNSLRVRGHSAQLQGQQLCAPDHHHSQLLHKGRPLLCVQPSLVPAQCTGAPGGVMPECARVCEWFVRVYRCLNASIRVRRARPWAHRHVCVRVQPAAREESYQRAHATALMGRMVCMPLTAGAPPGAQTLRSATGQDVMPSQQGRSSCRGPPPLRCRRRRPGSTSTQLVRGMTECE